MITTPTTRPRRQRRRENLLAAANPRGSLLSGSFCKLGHSLPRRDEAQYQRYGSPDEWKRCHKPGRPQYGPIQIQRRNQILVNPVNVREFVFTMEGTYRERPSGLFRDFPLREMHFGAVLFRFSTDTKFSVPAKLQFYKGLMVGAKGFEPSTPSLPSPRYLH